QPARWAETKRWLEVTGPKRKPDQTRIVCEPQGTKTGCRYAWLQHRQRARRLAARKRLLDAGDIVRRQFQVERSGVVGGVGDCRRLRDSEHRRAAGEETQCHLTRCRAMRSSDLRKHAALRRV